MTGTVTLVQLDNFTTIQEALRGAADFLDGDEVASFAAVE